MGITVSGIFFMHHYEEFTSDSYIQTTKFQWDYSRLVHNVVELNTVLISEDNIKNMFNEESDKEDSISSGTANEEFVEIADIQNDEASVETTNQNNEEIRKMLQRLHRINTNLSKSVNFLYYIRNTESDEIITNIENGDPLSYIEKQSAVVRFDKWDVDYQFPMAGDIQKMLSDTNYEVYTALKMPLEYGDSFYTQYIDYYRIKDISQWVLLTLIASLIVFIIAFSYLLCVSGRKEKNGPIHLAYIDKIYTDVHSGIVLIAAIASVFIVSNLSMGSNNRELIIGALIVFGIDVWIGLSYIFSMVRQIKNNQLIKNTLIYGIFSALKGLFKLCFSSKLFRPWTLIFLLAYGIINGILFSIFAVSWNKFFPFIFIIIFNIAAIYFTSKALASLHIIMGAVKEISSGNMEYSVNINKISTPFLQFYGNIQKIQDGLKNAIAEALKGERMKIDLITNVSHDLKTPITSIITYVDLLKQEDLNIETAEKYVSILDEKSLRLKHLVEDLIEASKASSGNLSVQTEKINLYELIQQAYGEFEDKINNAQLDIRIQVSDQPPIIRADGKHMWRIIENLLSNVVKYSLINSRVYMDITASDTHGILTIKNISSSPLDMTPEQLTERFVRGDESRTTEGSGLGLSIAQSLTALQGGQFEIQIDGDLFKTIVKIPLWKEEYDTVVEQ